MATENASSPVEQPAIQIRIGSLINLFLRIAGKTVSLSSQKVSGSRKKEVTGISTSKKSASSSPLSVRKNFRYSERFSFLTMAILRAIRL